VSEVHVSPEPVLYGVRHGVATITLNRPERMNSFSDELADRYYERLWEAALDPMARVVVVTGSGPAFCAGQDMAVLEAAVAEGAGPGTNETVDESDITSRALVTASPVLAMAVPKPVIAAINGACAGIGFVVALSCDIRIAAAGAKLTSSFVRRGLTAEHGLGWLLPRVIGQARALDFLLSGRVILAEEAAALGIVNRVVPADRLMDETYAYARDIAIYSSPASMAAIKRQVLRGAATDFATSQLEAVRMMLRSPVPATDFNEGVASFVEKREPRFDPLSREPQDPFS
jgi:enoyl-CoA hydratase/carnithine racemase